MILAGEKVFRLPAGIAFESYNMKKSERKTFGGKFRLPDKHTTTKPVWFPRSEGVGAHDKFQTYCDKHGLAPIRTFDSWNQNEGLIALALDGNDRILLFDSDGSRPWLFTPAQSMEFMSLMCTESQAGDHFWGERYFYEVLAAALKGGAK